MLSTILAFLAPMVAFAPREKIAPVEAKPDPFSIDGLIGFLETRDPGEGYDFTSGACLFGLYAEYLGYGGASFNAQARMFTAWNDAKGTKFATTNLPFRRAYPAKFVPLSASIAFAFNGLGEEETMSGALTRARAYRAKHT